MSAEIPPSKILLNKLRNSLCDHKKYLIMRMKYICRVAVISVGSDKEIWTFWVDSKYSLDIFFLFQEFNLSVYW